MINIRKVQQGDENNHAYIQTESWKVAFKDIVSADLHIMLTVLGDSYVPSGLRQTKAISLYPSGTSSVFAILKAVLMLFRLCLSENVSRSVAEIHGTDFLAFGGTYLCLVPLPVVSHTASYCEVLFVKVDVLPSQTTHFSDTKPCVIGYLHREQCGIVFLFQEVLQHQKLLVVNGRSVLNFAVLICKQFVFSFLPSIPHTA